MESKFESICNELVTLQKAKNADYGDSFSKSVKEFGLTAVLIPITNKVNRLKQLLQTDEAQVKDESIDDTLKDIACYAIMTLAERKDSLAGRLRNITPGTSVLLSEYIKCLKESISIPKSEEEQISKIKDTCIGKLYFHVIPIIHKTRIR